jgi:hypothetical protein
MVVPVTYVSKVALSSCDELLTVSKPLPPSTRSVVADAFPPFLCRSQAMSLLLSCGNICAIWSIWAGFIGRAVRLGAARVPASDGLLKCRYHRTARKVKTRKTRTCGMLMLCCAMAVGGCGSVDNGARKDAEARNVV